MDEWSLSTELKNQFPTVGSYIGSLFKTMGLEMRSEKENATKAEEAALEFMQWL